MSVFDKAGALESVGVASTQHRNTKDQFWKDRENLIDTIEQAKKNGATQQEIAEAAELSRQRVAQFLKERKEDKQVREW
jgi:DNA-binding transcriptional regulator LsrR (DeoR family)